MLLLGCDRTSVIRASGGREIAWPEHGCKFSLSAPFYNAYIKRKCQTTEKLSRRPIVHCAMQKLCERRNRAKRKEHRPAPPPAGREFGAVEWIRTPTVLLPPAPQAGASANSATTAF